jgi:hypothetical protein
MWLLAIVITILGPDHRARTTTMRTEYPTQYTCSAALDRIDTDLLLSSANARLKARREKRVVFKVGASCGAATDGTDRVDWDFGDRLLRS